MIEFHPRRVAAPNRCVRILGVGGAGSNALDRMVLDGVNPAHLMAANTDLQALTSSVAGGKIQLGQYITRGMGSGGDPEVGRAAATEAAGSLSAAFDGVDVVFLIAGLGGGTGSGAAPVIAEMARSAGSMVISIVTLPFGFEGKRRAAQAFDALEVLQANSNAVICFENDRMTEMVSARTGIQDAFAAADHVITQCVQALSALLGSSGLMHLGFDDVRAALTAPEGGSGSTGGRALFAYGEAEGPNRPYDALARALKNPLMEKGRQLRDCDSILVQVSGGEDLLLNEVQLLMEEFNRHVSDRTRILFGTAVNARLNGRISVTILSAVEQESFASAMPTPKASRVPRGGGHTPLPPEPVYKKLPTYAPAAEARPAAQGIPGALTSPVIPAIPSIMTASALPVTPVVAPRPVLAEAPLAPASAENGYFLQSSGSESDLRSPLFNRVPAQAAGIEPFAESSAVPFGETHQIPQTAAAAAAVATPRALAQTSFFPEADMPETAVPATAKAREQASQTSLFGDEPTAKVTDTPARPQGVKRGAQSSTQPQAERVARPAPGRMLKREAAAAGAGASAPAATPASAPVAATVSASIAEPSSLGATAQALVQPATYQRVKLTAQAAVVSPVSSVAPAMESGSLSYAPVPKAPRAPEPAPMPVKADITSEWAELAAIREGQVFAWEVKGQNEAPVNTRSAETPAALPPRPAAPVFPAAKPQPEGIMTPEQIDALLFGDEEEAPAPAVVPEPKLSQMATARKLNAVTLPTTEPTPAPASKTVEFKLPQQETLPFESTAKGRFERSEPTIEGGQNLDVPTFMRKNIRIR